MKGLVLAAGRGSRLHDVTNGGNKCLIDVTGKPLVMRIVEDICRLPSIKECVIVVGHMAEEVIEAVGYRVNGARIVYVRQEKQVGLINAIESACSALDGDDFFMALGDEMILDNNYSAAMAYMRNTDIDVLIGSIKVKDRAMVKKTYTFRFDSYGHPMDFIEKPEHPFNNIMGTGNVFFRGHVAELLREVPINPLRGERELVDLFGLMVKRGYKLSTFSVGRNYVNMNTLNDFCILKDQIIPIIRKRMEVQAYPVNQRVSPLAAAQI